MQMIRPSQPGGSKYDWSSTSSSETSTATSVIVLVGAVIGILAIIFFFSWIIGAAGAILGAILWFGGALVSIAIWFGGALVSIATWAGGALVSIATWVASGIVTILEASLGFYGSVRNMEVEFLVTGTRSIYISTVSLTFPAIVNTFTTFSAKYLLLALQGAITGLFVGCIKRAIRFKSEFGKKFLAELFTLKIFKTDQTFASTMILTLLVGSAVGYIAEASGTPDVVKNILDSSQPMAAIVSSGSSSPGGGAGGAGGAGGMGGFLWIELIIMVFIVQGILIGASSGLIIGASMGALGGAIKGAAFNSVVSLVSPSDIPESKGKLVVKTLRKGTIQGCIVGGFVGLTQGIIAAIRINI